MTNTTTVLDAMCKKMISEDIIKVIEEKYQAQDLQTAKLGALMVALTEKVEMTIKEDK